MDKSSSRSRSHNSNEFNNKKTTGPESSSSPPSPPDPTDPLKPFSAANLTQEQRNGIQQIRAGFPADRPLPDDLNTDIFLLKWWINWKGSAKDIVSRLIEYVENRRAAHLDNPHLLTTYREYSAITRIMSYFDISSFDKITVNELNNCVVTVFRMEGLNYDELVTIMKSSDFMNALFLGCEYYNQVLLEQEKKSGKPSGLMAIVDCTNLTNLSQYVNPSSACMRIGKLCLTFLAGWYGETWTELIVYNPPFISLVNITLKMAALVVPKRILDKITVIKTLDELQKRIPNVPLRSATVVRNDKLASKHNIFITTGVVRAVGSVESTLSGGPSSAAQATQRPQIWPTSSVHSTSSEDTMTSADKNSKKSTSSELVGAPKAKYLKTVTLKGASTMTDSFKIAPTASKSSSSSKGSMEIFWWFQWTGGVDFEFHLRYEKEPLSSGQQSPTSNNPTPSSTTIAETTTTISPTGILLHPKYTLACFKLPEEGSVPVDSFEKDAPGIGKYCLSLRNTATYTSSKVTFAFEAFNTVTGQYISTERSSPPVIK